MTAPRTRKQAKEYDNYQQKLLATRGEVCEFCEIDAQNSQFVAQTKHFKVIQNIFAYSLWDGQDVADHLMIVPKQHVGSLDELEPSVAADFFKLLASYEKQGYNIYARAPQSTARTIVHQRTHLIKNLPIRRKLLIYIRKPHIRFVR